jgi:hypothetical protein
MKQWTTTEMSPDEIHALIKRSGKTERRNGKVKTQVSRNIT